MSFTPLLRNAIQLLPSPHVPSGLQNKTTELAGLAASHLLDFEKKEVAFHVHPLQSLYQAVKKIAPEERIATLEMMLNSIPKTLSKEIFFEVWAQATDPDKGGDRWGEYRALNDYPLLLKAIQTIVDKVLDHQSEATKHTIYGTLYKIAGEPQTFDLKWGETNAHNDTTFLIRALHRHHCLGIPGKEISVYTKFEKEIETPSQTYHLY